MLSLSLCQLYLNRVRVPAPRLPFSLLPLKGELPTEGSCWLYWSLPHEVTTGSATLTLQYSLEGCRLTSECRLPQVAALGEHGLEQAR